MRGHMGGDRVLHRLRQRDLPSLPALRQTECLPVAREQFRLPADMDLTDLEVDVVGGKREDLALSKTEARAKPDRESVVKRPGSDGDSRYLIPTSSSRSAWTA